MNNKIKLLVWDLDNTIWEGVLAEDEKIKIDDKVKNIIIEMDKRGILQSVCSKNEHEAAMKKLKEFDIAEYFLYPQINWNSKASNILKIIDLLNISTDSVAFVDDQEFEREEVKFTLPEVTCMDISQAYDILNMEAFLPKFITDESQKRRTMYQADIERKKAEEQFVDSQDAFLESLNLEMQVKKAEKEDLMRLAELTVRTHQLNTTGIIYTYDELSSLLDNPNYRIYVCSATDIYGDYGKVGMAVLKIGETWTIKLFITSCRVMSRGIGKAFLAEIINKGMNNNKEIFAEFQPTDRNRIMSLTYARVGFVKKKVSEPLQIWKYEKKNMITQPYYIKIKWEEKYHD